MILTFEERLSLVFGKPLFEQEGVQDLDLDKRMGVTKEYTAYLKRMDRIKDLLHKAREFGMDQEFKEILQSAIGDRINDISKENPINPRESIRIINAIARSGFEASLAKRAASHHRARNPRAKGKSRESEAFNKAIEFLKQDGGEGSISRLVNPRNMNTSKRRVFNFDTQGKFDLDPTRRGMADMVNELTSKLEDGGRADLILKLQKGFAARSMIFQSIGSMNQDQSRYTAMLYALYNVAQEFEEYQHREPEGEPEDYELQSSELG